MRIYLYGISFKHECSRNISFRFDNIKGSVPEIATNHFKVIFIKDLHLLSLNIVSETEQNIAVIHSFYWTLATLHAFGHH